MLASVDNTLSPDEIYAAGHASYQKYGVAHHHLSSFHHLTTSGIKQIMEDYFRINVEHKIVASESKINADINKIYVDITFTNVSMHKPMISTSQGMVPAYPNKILNDGGTYEGALYITINIVMKIIYNDGHEETKTEIIKDRNVGSIPIMVGSKMCNLYNETSENLLRLGEDPMSEGGYFIINGGMWAIVSSENIGYNSLRCYYNEGHLSQLCNCHMISKPGDGFENSSQIILILKQKFELIIKIDVAPYKEIQFPFFTLFRVLGWHEDRKLVSHIIPGYNVLDEENIQLSNILEKCFQANYTGFKANMTDMHDSVQIIKTIYEENREIYNFDFTKAGQENNAVDKFLTFLDKHFLTHVGNGADSRIHKMIELAEMVRKTLMTYITKQSTDRDSYTTKRVIPAGYGLGKPFKSYFNTAVAVKFRNAIINALRKKPVKDINIAQDFAIRPLDSNSIGRLIQKEITNGSGSKVQITPTNSKIKRTETRVVTLKNNMNVVDTLRAVSLNVGNSGKTSGRATDMRSIHPSATGYICVIASPEGENVGVNKSMTVFSIISDASSSKILKDKIAKDPDLILLMNVTPEMRYIDKLVNVYVNGFWIGCVKDAIGFIRKYKIMRRLGQIHNMVTIQWEYLHGEIRFWTDYGRILHPMFIVYNNVDNPEMFRGSGFQQGILYDKKMYKELISGKIVFEDLIKNGVMEYLAPEEKENNLIAVDISKLKEHEFNDLVKFQYCNIPEGLLSITVLNSPFGQCNPPIRVTYHSNHARQACGIPVINYDKVPEKELYVEYTPEKPLCGTAANLYTRYSGSNIMVLYACFTGHNQEDSIIYSQGAIDRCVELSKFTYIIVEIENGEQIGKPPDNTIHIKSSNSYKKLENGIISEKTYVQKGDVLISKYMKMNEPKGDFIYMDKSVVYEDMEPGYVTRIHVTTNDEGNEIYKIHIKKIRPVVVGDKFSSRHGQKGVVSITLRDSDLPFTAEGLVPQIIVNPHGMPSRMTIAQLYEACLATVCSLKGTTVDTTYFRANNPLEYGKELLKYGYDMNCEHIMYNPTYGIKFDSKLFMGLIYYLRLQKFAWDNLSIIGDSVTTDPLYRQPTSGTRKGGGFRLGGMELDVMIAQGAVYVLRSKLYDDSNGFVVYVCNSCGQLANVHEKTNKKDNIGNKYGCKICGTKAEIVQVNSQYSTNILFNLIRGMGIGTKFMTEPPKFNRMLE